MNCPQCKNPINGIHPATFGTGWCRLDIHLACLPMHVRSCQARRAHNEAFIAQFPLFTESYVKS